MSTYSVSEEVALAQSVEEGAAIEGRPLSLPISFLTGGTGVFASLAWVGFGLSCLWWQDIGDQVVSELYLRVERPADTQLLKRVPTRKKDGKKPDGSDEPKNGDRSRD